MTIPGIDEIIIIQKEVSFEVLSDLAKKWHTVLVKGVVDVEQGVVALGGEWHMDANTVLIEHGSQQKNIWGFNIYPEEQGEDILEYISLINIRPLQNNRSMEVEDEALRIKMKEIIAAHIPFLFDKKTKT